MGALRFLALLLLCSGAAAEDRRAETCGDGRVHQVSYCAAVQLSPGASGVGSTTVNCIATTDTSDGTQHACVTTNNTELTCAQIETCSGGAAVNGNSSSTASTSRSVNITSLSESTNYYCQTCNESPELWYSNVGVSAQFTTSEASGEVYDLTLGGTRTPPAWVTSSFNQPTLPTTSSTSNVSSLPTVSSGVRYVIAPGTYSGNLTIANVTDVDIVATGVTVNGTLQIGSGSGPGVRVRVTGGTFNGSPAFDIDSAVGQCTDIVFDNVRLNTDGTSNSISGNFARVAFINSTLTKINSASAGDWNIFSSGSSSPTDLLIANTAFRTNDHQTFRLSGASIQTGVQRVVVVDSVFNGDGAGSNAFRMAAVNYAWVADIKAVRGSSFDGLGAYNMTGERWDTWGNGGSMFVPAAIGTGTISDSTRYRLDFTTSGALSVSGYTDGGGNVTADGTGDYPGDAGVGADH